MTASFYHFMRAHRGNTTDKDIAELAECISHDGMFPKHSSQYDMISRYLETNVTYVPSMTIFDKAWCLYMNETDY